MPYRPRILAPSFADSFAANCGKNGILTAAVTEEVAASLLRNAAQAEHQLTIDLEQRTLVDDGGGRAAFAAADIRCCYLLEGLDDIALTLQRKADIAAYEQRVAGDPTAFRGLERGPKVPEPQ